MKKIHQHIEAFGVLYITIGLMFFPVLCLAYDAIETFITGLI
jgi:hypothetical protein